MAKKSVRPTSEKEILRFLQDQFPCKSTTIKKGIGDDAAVVHPKNAGEYWLITTDMLVENIDFRGEWTTPRQLGNKSISVNLSDLAAMGAPGFSPFPSVCPQEFQNVGSQNSTEG